MQVKSLEWRNTIFTLLLVVSLISLARFEEPQVKTWLGKIRGSWKMSYNGKRYAAFEGIPYAKPPVKDLRFEEPQAIAPWQGVWSATKLYTCLQMGAKAEGTEDCLYLNVYVPGDYMNLKKTYAVVVNIHGGGFMVGSGHTMANSKFFMDRDMIVVTFNYRLGIFGFLSTEDEQIPGNNGLKDQVLALKWVKLNIASFGGNPNTITLTGVSAGGASVHLHYFSHLSKGLFVRGMSHSGSALHPWVIKRHPVLNAKKLAVLSGCSYTSTKEMKKCFKKKQAKDFLEKYRYFYGYGSMPFTPFGPVIEIKSKHPFLTKNPYALYHQKRVLDAPWVSSSCAHEGLLPTALHYNELPKIDKSWHDVAHFLLDYNYTVPLQKRKYVAGQIRKFYMGNEKISKKSFQNFTRIFTERLFTSAAEIAVKFQSQINESPVYYYLFNYRNGTNNIARNYTIQGSVCHGEDAIYFYGAFIFREFSAEDKKIRDTCLDIVHSYATTGNPAFGRAILWQPTKANELVYLNITDSSSIKLQRTHALSQLDFWRKLGLLENERLAVKDEL